MPEEMPKEMAKTGNADSKRKEWRSPDKVRQKEDLS